MMTSVDKKPYGNEIKISEQTWLKDSSYLEISSATNIGKKKENQKTVSPKNSIFKNMTGIEKLCSDDGSHFSFSVLY